MDVPEARAVEPPRVTPIRISALMLAAFITGIVWMSYHYTGGLVAEALELLARPGTDSMKDGIIQLLSAVVQNMVALTAVGGLIGAIVKLCEN